jgi:hypothetical protein
MPMSGEKLSDKLRRLSKEIKDLKAKEMPLNWLDAERLKEANERLREAVTGHKQGPYSSTDEIKVTQHMMFAAQGIDRLQVMGPLDSRAVEELKELRKKLRHLGTGYFPSVKSSYG